MFELLTEMEESEENPIDRNLPVKYTYREISKTSKEWNFRIVEVRDECAAEKWLKQYSELTKTTWRVLRTYTYGKFNRFKKDYRCSHFTDRRATGQRSSKHTGCEAKLDIVIKRFIKKTKRKDMLNRTHPCIVRIKNQHNHALTSPLSLKYRDLSSNVIQKFIDLYHQGYTPLSALKRHKVDLMIEKGEEFNQAAVDGKVMPTLSKVDHLFQKEFIKTHGGLSGYRDMLKARKKALKSEGKKVGTKEEYIPILTGSYSLADLQLPSASSDVQVKNVNLHKNYTENEGQRAVQNLLMEDETLPISYSEVDPQLPSPSSTSHDVTGDLMSQDESDHDETLPISYSEVDPQLPSPSSTSHDVTGDLMSQDESDHDETLPISYSEVDPQLPSPSSTSHDVTGDLMSQDESDHDETLPISYSEVDPQLPSPSSTSHDVTGDLMSQDESDHDETLPISYSEVDPQLPSPSSTSHDVTGDLMSQDESDHDETLPISYSEVDPQLPSPSSTSHDVTGDLMSQDESDHDETLPISYSEVDPQLPSPSSTSHDVTGDLMSQDESDHDENSEEFKESLSYLEGFFNRIKEGIRSKPEIFLPAVEKLKENVSKYAAAETGLINGLHTFGMPSDVQGTLKQNCAEKMRNDCPKTIIILPSTSTHYATHGTRHVKICPMPSKRREGPYILQLNKAM